MSIVVRHADSGSGSCASVCGLVEAVLSMGGNTWTVVRTVLVPESLPSLISSATTTVVALIGYSAMAGTVGAGGLGDIAIR